MVTHAEAEALRAASRERLVALLIEHNFDAMNVIADSVYITPAALTFQRLATEEDVIERSALRGEAQTVWERIAITPEIAADLLGWTP